MKLTKKKAKELCIKKWEWIVENDGSDDNIIYIMTELTDFYNECAYCELYLKKVKYPEDFCKGCPLNINDEERSLCGCNTTNHPFDKWQENKTKKNAKAVLDLIKKS